MASGAFDEKIDEFLEFVSAQIAQDERIREKIIELLKEVGNPPKPNSNLVDYIYKILLREGKPISTSEILEKVALEGYWIRGRNPKMALSAKLRNDTRFSYSADPADPADLGWCIVSEGSPPDKVTEDQLKVLAANVVNSLNDNQKTECKEFKEMGAIGVPHEVDLALLKKFRTAYKRMATEDEKIDLRRKLYDSLTT